MKYELTDETIKINEIIVYCIKALKSFGQVKEGDFGGYVQSEKNLDQDGTCWVYDAATVMGNAKITDDAQIHDSCLVNQGAAISKKGNIMK